MAPMDAAPYLILDYMHGTAGRWDEQYEIRQIMRAKKIEKEPGRAQLELSGKTHTFYMDDQQHKEVPQILKILGEVRHALRLIGYVLLTITPL